MAKSNGSNGDQVKREAREKAQGFMKHVATPVEGATSLDAMFAPLANTVLANTGTYVALVRVPDLNEITFEDRVELALSRVAAMKAEDDHENLVDAVVHANTAASHDRRKIGYAEALRIAAETFCAEQNAAVTPANVDAVIKQFRAITGDQLPKVARRVIAAVNGKQGVKDSGLYMLRRDRRKSGDGDKPASFDVAGAMAKLT